MSYVGGGAGSAGCVFCDALGDNRDRERLVLLRGERAFLILNAFPYTSGHLMVVPNRHLATLAAVALEELTEVMALAQRATEALSAEYRAEGFNIGINQGRVAGAGIADHLHVHVVPRWSGDSNFMSTVGEVRVLPEALDVTYDRLRSRLVG